MTGNVMVARHGSETSSRSQFGKTLNFGKDKNHSEGLFSALEESRDFVAKGNGKEGEIRTRLQT
jgi:hypothetical protein